VKETFPNPRDHQFLIGDICEDSNGGSGGVIALPATFSGEHYSLTAEVAKDYLFDFIPRRKLLDLLRQNPSVGF
jgi:hypothetical protein